MILPGRLYRIAVTQMKRNTVLGLSEPKEIMQNCFISFSREFIYSSGSQNLVLELAALAMPENLLEIQNLRPKSRLRSGTV